MINYIYQKIQEIINYSQNKEQTPILFRKPDGYKNINTSMLKLNNNTNTPSTFQRLSDLVFGH